MEQEIITTDLYSALLEISKMYTGFCDCLDDGTPMFYHGTTLDIEFNLETKSIYAKDYLIMSNGELVREEIQLGNGKEYKIKELMAYKTLQQKPYDMIEKLYYNYYHSIPSEKETQVNHYFKSLTADEIGLNEINKGISRIEARCALEGYILIASVLKRIPWEHENHFFWASPNQEGLVLYKKWVA